MTQRALVIDDNPADMELLAYLLQAFDCATIPATDGREVPAALRGQPPALIVCDVDTPHLNLHELLRTCRHDRQQHRIPMVAIAALTTPGRREQLLEAGFAACLGKPIDPEAFIQCLETCLLRRPASS